MGQNMETRVVSVAASALFMGAAVMGALTMSYTIKEQEWRAPPGIQIFRPPPEPPPKPVQPVRHALAPIAPTEPAQSAPVAPEAPAEAVSFPVAPQAPVVGPVEIVDPHWTSRPAGLDRYYPRRAREAGREGAALLDCRVTTSGALACVVFSETPGGWGFGAAALRMAGDYRMTPAMRDDVPVEGRYRMRVPFRLD